MLKKRLIGAVTVKNGWAVQSFGYNHYLPLGRPEVIVQNLDRWGADEILLQCIDRSNQDLGPDFNVLANISRLGISTPLIYAGGVRGTEDAKMVINKGADRVMIDFALRNNPESIKAIASELGAQALIANLLVRSHKGVLLTLDYQSGTEIPLTESIANLPISWVSEILLTDWPNEGHFEAFNINIFEISEIIKKPLICFGGISSAKQIKRLLGMPAVVGIGIGNFLNYKEHALQSIKELLVGSQLRPAYYEDQTA
jgi:cyclase